MSVSALNSTNIYSSGDIFLEHPVECLVVSLVLLILAALSEFLFHIFHERVRNKYLRVIVDAIVREVMIIGMLIMLLLFTQSVYDWPSIWVFFFKFSMMSLLAMVVAYVIVVMVLVYFAGRLAESWRQFETNAMERGEYLAGEHLLDVATGQTQNAAAARASASLSSEERRYKLAAHKFTQCVMAFGYEPRHGIVFSVYFSKMMRRYLFFHLVQIKWISWVVLATTVVLNGLRAEATMRLSLIGDENVADALSDWQRFVNYFSYVLLVGYGSTLCFGILWKVLSDRADQYLKPENNGSGGRGGGHDEGGSSSSRAMGPGMGPVSASTVTRALTLDDLDDPRTFLFRRSLEGTLNGIQALLLITQFYGTVFALGFVYQCFTSMEEIGYGIAVFVAALVPMVLPLCFFLPKILFSVTLLGSLGRNLDEFAVQHMIRDAKVPRAEWPKKMVARFEVLEKRQKRMLVAKDKRNNSNKE